MQHQMITSFNKNNPELDEPKMNSFFRSASNARSSMCTTKSDLFPKCLFYLFKIFGVAPFIFRSEFTIPFATSRLGQFYNLLLSFLIISLSYFSLKHSLYGDYAGRVALEKIVDTVQTIFTIFTSLFVLAVFCIFQERIVELANRLYAIYKLSICLTNKMGYDVHFGPSLLIKSVKRIVIVNSVLSVLWFIAIFFNVDIFFLYFIVMTPNNFIILSILLQYSLILKLLHYLYRWVNADLISLLKASNVSRLQQTTTRLFQLLEIHLSLSHVCRDVSRFYSLPMLICIGNVFLTLIIYGYYVVRAVVIWNSKLPAAALLQCVMLLVINLVLTMTLARAAGITVRESKTTGEIVSESIATCQNERIAKQLKEFSIYLLHKNVGFCIFHIFSLNETFVVSIISSITTYLVILIQFKESSQL